MLPLTKKEPDPMSPNRTALLHEQLKQRILILDGAMGTMIQTYKLPKRTIVANVLPAMAAT